MSNSDKKQNKKYPMTAKRILAMAGIVILVLLYVVTLISALIGTEFARSLFYASLFSTFFVPVMIWVFLLRCIIQ